MSDAAEIMDTPAPDAATERPIIEIDDLRTYFYTRDGVVRAVDGVSFQVHRGETVCVVGESGCGKSVTAMSVLRLIPEPPGRIVGGLGTWLFASDPTRALGQIEIAREEASARLSRCSSMSIWNACCDPPQAFTISPRPSPFLARISY